MSKVHAAITTSVDGHVSGQRLFTGVSRSPDLEHVGVRQSPFATFVDDRVRRGVA